MSFGSWVINMADPDGRKGGELDYWSLVGRVSITFAIPILGAFFWLGQLSSRVDHSEQQQGHLLEVIGGLVTLGASHSEKLSSDGTEIVRLRDNVDALIRQSFATPQAQKVTP